MKSKILTLIIGILIGAIITTTGFLIYNKTLSKNSDQPETMQMDGNGEKGKPSNGDGQNGNMEEPPSKPSGDNSEEPPSKPSGDNSEKTTSKPDDTNNNSNS